MPCGLGSGRQPSIGASQSRGGRPRLRHCSGQIGGEPPRGRAAIWRSPPKATFAPGSWSSTSWRRRSWPRPSVCWPLGTPEATAVRPVTERELAAAGRSRTAAAISRLRRRTSATQGGSERASSRRWRRSVMYRRTLESKFRASPNGALPSATAGPSTSTVTIWEEGGACVPPQTRDRRFYGLIPSPSPAARPKLETVFLSI